MESKQQLHSYSPVVVSDGSKSSTKLVVLDKNRDKEATDKLNSPQLTTAKSISDIIFIRNPPSYRYKEIVDQIVAKEGWDNSIHCYDLWKRSFAENCFSLWCAVDKNTDKIVGTMTLAFHQKRCEGEEQLCHWSMYFIKPEYRNLSIGRRLFDKTLEELGETNSFWYGVETMWHKYAQHYGGDKYADWRLFTTYGNCADIKLGNMEPIDSNLEIKSWRQVPFDQICAFDLVVTAGVNRIVYLYEAINHPNSMTLVGFINNEIVGICQLRGLLGNRLGVSLFYAKEEIYARTLIKKVLEVFPKSLGRALCSFGRIVYKTPSTNLSSNNLFSRLVDGNIVERQMLVPQFTKYVVKFPTEIIYSIVDEHAGVV